MPRRSNTCDFTLCVDLSSEQCDKCRQFFCTAHYKSHNCQVEQSMKITHPKILNPARFVRVFITNDATGPANLSAMMMLYDTSFDEIIKIFDEAIKRAGALHADNLPADEIR